MVYAREEAIRNLLKIHVCSPIDKYPFVYYTAYIIARKSTDKEPTKYMNKAAIYVRVSTADQHVESQLYDLRELAAHRGLEVVQEYRDCGVSGKRARRPGLDALIADARRKKFSVCLVAAFDRVARSVKHFLQLMDEFDSLGVVFISRRENIDTSGPMG